MAEMIASRPAANAVAKVTTRTAWPWLGILAGITGFVRTILADIHVVGDDRDGPATTMALMSQLDQQKAHFSVVAGFIAVVLSLARAPEVRPWVSLRAALLSGMSRSTRPRLGGRRVDARVWLEEHHRDLPRRRHGRRSL